MLLIQYILTQCRSSA